jgi:hypothetical protein
MVSGTSAQRVPHVIWCKDVYVRVEVTLTKWDHLSALASCVGVGLVVPGASGPAGKNNPRGRNAKLNAIFKSDFQIKGWVGSGDFA